MGKIFFHVPILQKKIEEGFCQQEFQQYMRKEGKNLAFFRDEHLVMYGIDMIDLRIKKYGKKGTGKSYLL